ncbi:hypothetical protein K9N68_32550 [Kovacikia minuta CCNUW1]|uniref:hypothetical protein n=1 Tax=Kovacikia minuta TaxID=2931930 RepID=UPI001CCC3434|nr:hypothetical protein [Kovacikia minuta]UBF26193.1 hypothetical protein K9N68_32550 [Kovacikia minuta CCNUW1]
MSQSSVPPALTSAFDEWVTAQILKLSVDALSAGVLTCTACAESTTGEYVIEYQGETFRYLPEKTYAFLKFVMDGSTRS